MKKGKYLTPPLFFKREIRTGEDLSWIEGAVYDENYQLIDSSQRPCLSVISNDSPLLRHASPLLDFDKKEFYYLGHCCQQYGHFLLETMPMLSYLLEDLNSLGVFNDMPFGKAKYIFRNIDASCKKGFLATIETDNHLLKTVCKLLGVNTRRIRVNPHVPMRYSSSRKFEFYDFKNSWCIKSNFLVPPRPIVMESELIDKNPYKTIIERLHHSARSDFGIEKSENHYLDKVFVINRPKFFDKGVLNQVVSFFEEHGFAVINPLDYSLHQQIFLFSQVRVIAGFCGSSLHNSIFSESLEIIIEIGREGMLQCNPNQKICADISGADILFCKYGSFEEIKSRLSSIIIDL